MQKGVQQDDMQAYRSHLQDKFSEHMIQHTQRVLWPRRACEKLVGL
jgi:hypothetical protein